MDNKEKILRVGIALNELYKNGKTNVLIGEIFHTVTDILSSLDINYTFYIVNDSYNGIELT